MITASFEGKVARGFMLAARAVAGFPTRRPKERPGRLPLVVKRGDEFAVEELRLEQFPALLHVPLLAPAGHLYGRQATSGVEVLGCETISFGKRPEEAAASLATSTIRMTVNWDLTSFARLLAKVAYGFAVASVGPMPREEVPVLPLILGAADDASRWLGSATFSLDIESKRPTHAIGVHVAGDPAENGRKLLVVRIKLFADSGATGYEVIVWRPKEMPARVVCSTT
jgi:hypothetical protein